MNGLVMIYEISSIKFQIVLILESVKIFILRITLLVLLWLLHRFLFSITHLSRGSFGNNSLPSWGSVKVCVHSTVPRLHFVWFHWIFFLLLLICFWLLDDWFAVFLSCKLFNVKLFLIVFWKVSISCFHYQTGFLQSGACCNGYGKRYFLTTDLWGFCGFITSLYSYLMQFRVPIYPENLLFVGLTQNGQTYLHFINQKSSWVMSEMIVKTGNKQ